MKKIILLLPLLSLSCFAAVDSETKNHSVGFGIGAMYSGIGTNFSFVSKTDLKYISAGCTAYSSMTGSECGVGVGWIKTDLFDSNSNKHGFGVYVGSVGKESSYSHTSTLNGVEYYRHENNIYGVGVSYTYFMNGIDHSGTTFGISVHATNAEFESNYGGFFQVGYQF